MELFEKSVDRFQDLSIIIKPSKKNFFEEYDTVCHIDHVLLESCSCYGSTKF